jgi:hypothetical protein
MIAAAPVPGSVRARTLVVELNPFVPIADCEQEGTSVPSASDDTPRSARSSVCFAGDSCEQPASPKPDAIEPIRIAEWRSVVSDRIIVILPCSSGGEQIRRRMRIGNVEYHQGGMPGVTTRAKNRVDCARTWRIRTALCAKRVSVLAPSLTCFCGAKRVLSLFSCAPFGVGLILPRVVRLTRR